MEKIKCIDCGKLLNKWAKRNGNIRCPKCSAKNRFITHPIESQKFLIAGHKNRKNKTFDEFYGYRKAKLIKQKISKSNKNQVRTTKHKLKYKLSKLGSKNPNYKDGCSKLKTLIYKSKLYKAWRLIIFLFDNYTCQKCGQIGGKLQVYHKKSFSKLFEEFINKYKNIKSKERLIKLSWSYTPFWDLSNGQTLCEECHKETDNYGHLKKQIE